MDIRGAEGPLDVLNPYWAPDQPGGPPRSGPGRPVAHFKILDHLTPERLVDLAPGSDVVGRISHVPRGPLRVKFGLHISRARDRRFFPDSPYKRVPLFDLFWTRNIFSRKKRRFERGEYV